MQNNPTWVCVVAAALERADGRWLMHRRPADKQHGGLWEFPGGKVEPHENPRQALVRELAEELGIGVDPQALTACGLADHAGGPDHPALVILLYSCREWTGDPVALEGGDAGWFAADQILRLARPPLDVALCARLFAGPGHRDDFAQE